MGAGRGKGGIQRAIVSLRTRHKGRGRVSRLIVHFAIVFPRTRHNDRGRVSLLISHRELLLQGMYHDENVLSPCNMDGPTVRPKLKLSPADIDERLKQARKYKGRTAKRKRTSVPSGSGPSTPKCRCMNRMVLGVASASRLINRRECLFFKYYKHKTSIAVSVFFKRPTRRTLHKSFPIFQGRDMSQLPLRLTLEADI